MYHISFKEVPKDEKPYEKFMRYGAKSLSDAELLAIILRTGTKDYSVLDVAHHILNKNENSLLNLQKMSLKQLMEIPGIGKVKAIQLKCIAQLCVRMSRTSYYSKETLDSAKKIAEYYMEYLRHESCELTILLMLDTKCHMLGEEIISKGTVNASLVSPREIFLTALDYKAVQIVIIHNHPSGDPHPSREDLLVTKRLKSAGELIGIELVDHIIIGDNIYTSFKEEGLL